MTGKYAGLFSRAKVAADHFRAAFVWCPTFAVGLLEVPAANLRSFRRPSIRFHTHAVEECSHAGPSKQRTVLCCKGLNRLIGAEFFP
jgi:hypothetical protein